MSDQYNKEGQLLGIDLNVVIFDSTIAVYSDLDNELDLILNIKVCKSWSKTNKAD